MISLMNSVFNNGGWEVEYRIFPLLSSVIFLCIRRIKLSSQVDVLLLS
jgi:hypothetical protein